MEPVTTPELYHVLPLLIALAKTYGFLGLSGLGFYALARTWVSKLFANPFELLAISLISGPLLASWFFIQSLRLFPGLSPDIYIRTGHITALILGLVGLYFFIRDCPKKNADYYDDTKQWAGIKFQRVYVLAIGIVALLIFIDHVVANTWTTLLMPFSQNDAMEYATGAQLIAGVRDISIYPFVDAEQTGGFFGAWTHPPGYLGLLSWAYLANDGAPYGARVVSIYFSLVTLYAVWAFGIRRSPLHGLFCLLFTLIVPSTYVLGLISHIDPIRIAGLTIAGLSVYRLVFEPNMRNVLFCALIIGLAQFTHSIGILTSCLILPAYFICSDTKFLKKILHVGVLFGLSLVVILPDLFKNWQTFGSVIQDSAELWSLKELQIQELRDYNRRLSTTAERLYYGLLKGFSNPGVFGRSYTLFTLLILGTSAYLIYKERTAFFKKLATLQFFRKPQLHIYCLLIILGFYAMVILSMLVGSDIIIKNSRYFLTIQYFIAIVSGFILAEIALRGLAGERYQFLKKLPDNKRVRITLGVFLAVLVSGVTFYGRYHMTLSIRGQLDQFNITSQTKFDSYENKMLASVSRVYPAVSYLNTLWDAGEFGPDDRVLVFRKGEAGLYGKFKIRTHYDDTMIGLFEAQTKDQVYNFLQKNNIRYLLLPPYAQAEVYNSQFGDLIADHSYIELKYTKDGVRVFEVRSTKLLTPTDGLPADPQSPTERKIISINKDKQRVFATRCPLFGDCQNRVPGAPNPRIIDNESELFPSRATRGAFSWGGLHYVRLKTADNSGEKIALDPGVYKFTSDVDARGFVRIILFTYPQTIEGSGASSKREVIWSGLMSGKKTIETQFEVVPPYYSLSEWRKSERPQEEYGLAVELSGQGDATIGSVTLQQLSEDLSYTGNREVQYNALVKNQWSINTSKVSPLLKVPSTTEGKTLLEPDENEAIWVRSFDSRPISVTGPVYALRANDVLDAYGTVAAGSLSNTVIGPLTQVLGYSVKMSFSGRGVIQIGVDYDCVDGSGGSENFGWFLAEGFEQNIERNFTPSCKVTQWRPKFQTIQSLQVYGPGYHEIDIRFEVLDAKAYLSDRVTIKPIKLYPQTVSNNTSYSASPSTRTILRPEHIDGMAQDVVPGPMPVFKELEQDARE